MDFNEYREAYANLGEERVQIVEMDDNEDVDEEIYTTLEDRFFATRIDTDWVKLPGLLM